MVDALTLRRMIYWLLFAALSALVFFAHLLPIEVGAARLPAPDLILCLAFAWVLRRPDYVPLLLVALVTLLGDWLLLRPPGLWTALVLIGLEFLRTRQQFTREMPFPVEWAMVASVLLAATLANRLVLALFQVPQGGLGLTLLQLGATALAYPLVVLVTHGLLGVRRVAPGELEQMAGGRA